MGSEERKRYEGEFVVDETASGFTATVLYEMREGFLGKRVRVTIEELEGPKSLGQVAFETASAEVFDEPVSWDSVSPDWKRAWELGAKTAVEENERRKR